MELVICPHLSGKVSAIAVNVGDTLSEGQACVVLEVMGIEIPVESPVSGRVTRILCEPGQGVGEGDLLVGVDDGRPTTRPAEPARQPGSAADFDTIEPSCRFADVTPEELDALEAEYGTLPPRYREFMLRFGAVDHLSAFVVFAPDRVRSNTTSRRPFFKKHLLRFDRNLRLASVNVDLWPNADRVLVPDHATRLVMLAGASSGDLGDLFFVSGAPERLLWFPRPGSRDGAIQDVGPTFAHAIARYFEDDPTDEDDESE
jgi:pyruvate/2-oxoglutarate dehydrogenase complex dihydrolipoamide acyltransferase (E2) component